MTPVRETGVVQAERGRILRGILAGTFIAGLFLFLTWRGLLVYFTGDDLMNLYGYWTKPLSLLVKANIFFWTPYYRPFGGLIYLPLFAIFGFNPYPLYVVFFAAMLFNLWLAYLLFKKLSGSTETGAIATLLFAFHGELDYMYYNAGSLYDVFCFLFFSVALLIYLRARMEDRFLGVWGTLGFLACFICSINSKEMGATLPIVILLYELIWHPPDFRRIRALAGWCIREGRMALAGALVVLIYLPGKFGSGGIAQVTAYVPQYTWARWIADTGNYLGFLLYRHNPTAPLGITPLEPLGVAIFFAILIAGALWMRSRAAWFGLGFFVIALLPVSFIPPRLGFVLYLPLTGMALYAATALMRFKGALLKLFSDALEQPVTATAASVVFFIAVALAISGIDYRNWKQAPDGRYSPYKATAAEFSRLYPRLPHGAKLLFVHSPLDSNWDLVFLMRDFYRDKDLEITMLNGPVEQRIPMNRLPHYDHVFDYEAGHYVELDNADARDSVELHLLKVAAQQDVFGEAMTIGKPGAVNYIVKGMLIGDPKADGYWTREEAELRFRLTSTDHHFFRERYFLPAEVLKKTGPLDVEYYVNGHLLDHTRFDKDGDLFYEHDVPKDWLKDGQLTVVRMRFQNPYVSPRDGVKLGILLRSAGFGPGVPSSASNVFGRGEKQRETSSQ